MADEYTESGVPVLRGVNVNRGRFHDDDFVFIDNETADRLSKFESFPGDVLLVHKGTLGQIGLMPNRRKYPRYIMGNSMMRVRCDPTTLLPEYLYYWLTSADGQHYLFSRVSQVGVPQIQTPLTTLRQAELPIPPLSEQRAIAHILGTLDDKIELNRRMNETLEAMARAIFKSWFVDFEPIRAKMEGRWRKGESLPGLPAHLYDLFPDRLVDAAQGSANVAGGRMPGATSELGEIPEGWEVGTLGDVLTQRVDRCAPSDETRSRPYVPIECIAARSLLLSDSMSGEDAQSSLTKFAKGDLLFGAMRPYFHKVAISPFDGTTRTTVFVLRPKVTEDFAYAAMVLHDRGTIEYATNHSTGSTIPYAVWQGSLEAMPIVLPPTQVRALFDHLVRPFLDRIPPLFFENRTLAALRDALLPKLISGELRVKDAERLVGRGPATLSEVPA
jgi:type I restriction enzyme, S subunit